MGDSNVDKHIVSNAMGERADEISIKAIQISQRIEYLIENQTAKELIDTLEDNVFDDVIAMTLLSIEGHEAIKISETELESIIREALAALLKGREMDMDVLLDIADTSGMGVYGLIDEGIVIEYESNFYEGV